MENQFWVAVMRACPLHLWHQEVLKQMIKYHKWNCMLILWWKWHEFDHRHIFDYEDRKWIVKKLFEELDINGIEDTCSNQIRLANLDKIIKQKYNWDLSKVTYRWGCQEDVNYFIDNNRTVQTLNRFDGSTPVISATQVRERLHKWEDLDWYIDPKIQKHIRELYDHKVKLSL